MDPLIPSKWLGGEGSSQPPQIGVWFYRSKCIILILVVANTKIKMWYASGYL